MNKLDRCLLCKKIETLQKSHIIPKFLNKKMRNIGTDATKKGNLVTIIDGIYQSKTSQDTIKINLLCSDCEQNFGKLETSFSKNFHKELNCTPQQLYDKELYKFCLSVLWRTYYHFTILHSIELNFMNWEANSTQYLINSSHSNALPHIYYFRLFQGTSYAFNYPLGYCNDDASIKLYLKIQDPNDVRQGNLIYLSRTSIGLVISGAIDPLQHLCLHSYNILPIENTDCLCVLIEDILLCMPVNDMELPIFRQHEITRQGGKLCHAKLPNEANYILSELHRVLHNNVGLPCSNELLDMPFATPALTLFTQEQIADILKNIHQSD